MEHWGKKQCFGVWGEDLQKCTFVFDTLSWVCSKIVLGPKLPRAGQRLFTQVLQDSFSILLGIGCDSSLNANILEFRQSFPLQVPQDILSLG